MSDSPMDDMQHDTNQRLNLELERIGLNQLTELGNQAVEMRLIAGHGYHKGKYEILRKGKALTMTPDEAVKFLQRLIQSITQKNGE